MALLTVVVVFSVTLVVPNLLYFLVIAAAPANRLIRLKLHMRKMLGGSKEGAIHKTFTLQRLCGASTLPVISSSMPFAILSFART